MINQNDVVAEVLRMRKLYFKNIVFKSIGEEVTEQGYADIGFDVKHKINENLLEVELICKAKVDSLYVLELCLCGCFEALNIDVKRMLPNAIAIMFPYLRAQVSLVTSQPNIPTITLKPINVNALLSKQDMIND